MLGRVFDSRRGYTEAERVQCEEQRLLMLLFRNGQGKSRQCENSAQFLIVPCFCPDGNEDITAWTVQALWFPRAQRQPSCFTTLSFGEANSKFQYSPPAPLPSTMILWRLGKLFAFNRRPKGWSM